MGIKNADQECSSCLLVFNLCISFLVLLLLASASARGSVVKVDTTFTLRDSDGDSVVSEGGRFKLGFFTPEGLSSSGDTRRRYVGIWYGSTPEVVVWVANRSKPLYNNNGTFSIQKDGNLVVLASNGTSLWSTDLQPFSSPSRITTVRLMPSGNLILKGLSGVNRNITTFWQSFRNPTNTFLPGMNMTDALKLTSWKCSDDPSPGNFTFLKDTGSRYIIERLSAQYWVSKLQWQNFSSETDGKIAEIIDLLSKISAVDLNSTNYSVRFQNQDLDYNYTRTVMNSSGKLQYLARNRVSEKWDVVWSEPENVCSVVKACGAFASCRTDTKHTCRCLPGFVPKSMDQWDSGHYSGGCQRKTEICINEVPQNQTEYFLTINMKVKRTPNNVKVNGVGECKRKCLESCTCKAYSEIGTSRSDVVCAIWEDDLEDIWEYAVGGGDVNIRIIKPSDIELTKLDCKTCGTNIVPYPLSTQSDCGDQGGYLKFTCIDSTGQLLFQTAGDDYIVTNIDPHLNTFTIATDRSICRGNDKIAIQKLLKLEHSSPFKVSSGCDSEFNEIDIHWEKPLEPLCSSSKDCTNWPNSSCNSSTDGRKRCLCIPSFNWTGTGCRIPPEDGLNLLYSKQKTEEGIKVRIIVSVTFAGLIVIISCLVLYIYDKKRKLQNKKEQRTSFWRNQETRLLYESEQRVRDFMGSGMFGEDDRKAIEVPVFDLETILIATDNFSEANKIGRGGFGTVYKGLFGGGLEIAIKRLSKGSAQGVDEFKNEAILIAKLQHRNLVRLLGYCVAGEEKMLVYEYMPNKSLDFFIFDRTQCFLVNWEMRFNIIVGIARGLVYLHEDSRLRIIHRDMKTSNVLLDAKMNPKISDFGLARIFDGTQTEATTNRIVGTYGYMSPEYALDGSFSVKSDVFSFGIVVLEIVSGRRNTGFYKSKEALNLLGYVWNLWREKRALEIVEMAVRERCNPSEAIKCMAVGLMCVQEDPGDRPTMSNVAFMLSSGSDPASLPEPKQPAFVDKSSAHSSSSATNSSSGYKQETIVSSDCTLIEPR